MNKDRPIYVRDKRTNKLIRIAVRVVLSGKS